MRNRRERRLGDRLGPRFAAFDRELAGCLDGRLSDGIRPPGVVGYGEPRRFFDVSERCSARVGAGSPFSNSPAKCPSTSRYSIGSRFGMRRK